MYNVYVYEGNPSHYAYVMDEKVMSDMPILQHSNTNPLIKRVKNHKMKQNFQMASIG